MKKFFYAFIKMIGVILPPALLIATQGITALFLEAIGTPYDFLLLYCHLCCVMVAGIYYLFSKRRSGEVEIATARFPLSAERLGAIVGLSIAMQILLSGILTFVENMFPEMVAAYAEMMDTIVLLDDGPTALILSAITVGLVAPLAEELIFRGLVYKKLRGLLPVSWANVLQAVFFGVYHLNLIQGVYAFFLGLILGWLGLRYRSLWMSVAFHVCFNLSAYLLDFGWNILGGRGAFILSAPAVMILLYWIKADSSKLTRNA